MFFEKYKIIKNNCLGKGSFSMVYQGLQLKNNTPVAIKIITRIDMNEKMIERLSEEIIIMQKIKKNPHPNIVNCYDIYDEGNTVYIVMEFCDSGDLATIIREPIREVWVQYFMCQLVNGLKYLDTHSILHRDIKPKNILLTKDSKILKIADFGLARVLNKNSVINTLCGSPLYMAPEILNRNAYSKRTDLWSIGIIMYEMLFGHHPLLNCNTIDELTVLINNHNIIIPPLNNTNNITPECIELLKLLLKKKPENRLSWTIFFNHFWLNRFKFKNLKNEPVRANSCESLHELTKTKYSDTEDNELEHSQYSLHEINKS